MHLLFEIGSVLGRAVYLLALALAPPLLAPEPAPMGSPFVTLPLALLGLAALAYSAARLRARVPGRDFLAASVLLQLAIVTAAGAALFFREGRAPLARGLVFVAVPLWAGLAVAAAGVARRYFGKAEAAAAIAVLVIGGALYGASAGWLTRADQMWWLTLLRDGDTERAGVELTRPLLREHKPADARAIADACLALRPDSCGCLALRARLGVMDHAPDRLERATADARAATARCPASPAAHAILAEALALGGGEAEEAEREARQGLVQGESGRLHYVLALILDRTGRHDEALAEARRAVELGAGRDAALLLAVAAINAKDLDGAQKVLEPLAAQDPNDPEVLYDLGLVADQKGDYNRARQGYLAALRADPKLASARYNLVVLTMNRGVLEESKHHLARFREAFPDDPRGPALARRLAGK